MHTISDQSAITNPGLFWALFVGATLAFWAARAFLRRRRPSGPPVAQETPRGPRCSVLVCDRPPVTTVQGFRLCKEDAEALWAR